eukprot:scaffold532_cov216-Ochromonas_danica.AAC.2
MFSHEALTYEEGKIASQRRNKNSQSPPILFNVKVLHPLLDCRLEVVWSDLAKSEVDYLSRTIKWGL